MAFFTRGKEGGGGGKFHTLRGDTSAHIPLMEAAAREHAADASAEQGTLGAITSSSGGRLSVDPLQALEVNYDADDDKGGLRNYKQRFERWKHTDREKYLQMRKAGLCLGGGLFFCVFLFFFFPRMPSADVDWAGVEVHHFKFGYFSGISADVAFNMRLWNPNYVKIQLFQVDVTVEYRDKVIALGSVNNQVKIPRRGYSNAFLNVSIHEGMADTAALAIALHSDCPNKYVDQLEFIVTINALCSSSLFFSHRKMVKGPFSKKVLCATVLDQLPI